MTAVDTERKPAGPAQPHPSGDNRFKILEATMKRLQYQPDALIEVLHKAQELFGYLSTDMLFYIAHSLKLPPSRVFGVATFYHFFSLAPQGEHTCVICLGTACYVKGAAALLAAVEQAAGAKAWAHAASLPLWSSMAPLLATRRSSSWSSRCAKCWNASGLKALTLIC
jgi:bidirectional [NiFe] hydrogenase diaphorase subunit